MSCSLEIPAYRVGLPATNYATKTTRGNVYIVRIAGDIYWVAGNSDLPTVNVQQRFTLKCLIPL